MRTLWKKHKNCLDREGLLKTAWKFLRFFDQNLYGKLTFFTIFTKYFLDCSLRSESIDLWKITPDFYNNFSDFGGGGSPPPLPHAYATVFIMIIPKMDVFLSQGVRLYILPDLKLFKNMVKNVYNVLQVLGIDFPNSLNFWICSSVANFLFVLETCKDF